MAWWLVIWYARPTRKNQHQVTIAPYRAGIKLWLTHHPMGHMTPLELVSRVWTQALARWLQEVHHWASVAATYPDNFVSFLANNFVVQNRHIYIWAGSRIPVILFHYSVPLHCRDGDCNHVERLLAFTRSRSFVAPSAFRPTARVIQFIGYFIQSHFTIFLSEGGGRLLSLSSVRCYAVRRVVSGEHALRSKFVLVLFHEFGTWHVIPRVDRLLTIQ